MHSSYCKDPDFCPTTKEARKKKERKEKKKRRKRERKEKKKKSYTYEEKEKEEKEEEEYSDTPTPTQPPTKKRRIENIDDFYSFQQPCIAKWKKLVLIREFLIGTPNSEIINRAPKGELLCFE